MENEDMKSQSLKSCLKKLSSGARRDISYQELARVNCFYNLVILVGGVSPAAKTLAASDRSEEKTVDAEQG